MLTVTAFLFVYFSLSLLSNIVLRPQKFPYRRAYTFEAAMAIGALVFWLRMNWSGWTKGK